jgi:hypothetical protein
MSSVSFKEQVTRTATAAVPQLPKGKEDLVHEIGNALTQGGGPSGYLAVSYRVVVIKTSTNHGWN